MMFVLDALFSNLLVLIKITIVADYPCSISDRGRTGRKKSRELQVSFYRLVI